MAASQFDLDSCMMFITTRSSKLFANRFNQALNATGLGQSSWMALYYLNQHDQLNQRDLADLIGITGPSMVKIVSQLHTAGLISVTPSTTDKRERLLGLTPDGHQLLTKSLPVADNFQHQVTAGISQHDLDIVAQVMDQMVANAKEL